MGLGIPLIVIVIFLVVWIVSNVIRAQQDANQAAARRANAGNRQAAAPRPENRGNSDIDRFLQEIDRLRKKGQQEKTQQQDESAAPPPKPKPAADRERERERRSEPPRSRTAPPRPQRESRPAPPAPPPPPSSSHAPAPLVAELIAAPPPAPPSGAKPGSLASNIEAKAETARVAAEAASKAAPGAGARTTTPARRLQAGAIGSLPMTLQMIQKLFQTKQGVSVAVLLHEIFGPPRSMRG